MSACLSRRRREFDQHCMKERGGRVRQREGGGKQRVGASERGREEGGRESEENEESEERAGQTERER
jgi:hypothetical protein